jgi:type II secretory pathway component GspD/PulD (secretin)
MPLNVWAQNTILPEAPSAAPTITIDAKVVEILLNDEHRKGVDWEAIVSDFHSVQLKKENNPVWADKRFRLAVGQVSSEDYIVLLDALDTVGNYIQNDFLKIVLSKDDMQSLDVTPDPKNLPKIKLDLKWFSSSLGDPKIKIDPQLGIMIKDSSQPLQVTTLKGQTEIEFKDQTTIVIGGLFHEQEIAKIQKFPLLGDLPLVGLVFRKQGKLMQKTETIVFLTIHTNAVPMPIEEQK